MSKDISEFDFDKLCSTYPDLAKIGKNYLGPKFWILFNALKNGHVSEKSIAHKPCASLMENHVSFEDISNILEELHNNRLLTYDERGEYQLQGKVAYALQQLSYDVTQGLEKLRNNEISALIQESGYSSMYYGNGKIMRDLSSDDNNNRSNQFKELMSEVAYAGLRLTLKLMNKAEESIL